jgi:hypothetical protein
MVRHFGTLQGATCNLLLDRLAKDCKNLNMDTPIFERVLSELQARKGTWPEIAKAIEPDSWESYYSWMTKLATGKIPDPGVNKIQRLADYFAKVGAGEAATKEAA